jgi:uncharacterized protein YbaR (Trm112 family)
MFIELTDHLRCPADHPEQFLVLLPGTMEERSVLTGDLGCPVCDRMFRVVDGAVDFGGAPADEPAPSSLPSEGPAALLGLGGPGGNAVFVGGAAGDVDALLESLPGIGIIALNPPSGTQSVGRVSVLRAGMIPLKSSSVRGVVLGPGFADPHWVREGLRVTLAGLRVIGEGERPALPDLEIVGAAGACWVGTKLRNRI